MRGALATFAAVAALLCSAAGASGSTAPHGSIAGVVPHTAGLLALSPKGLSKPAGSPRSASFTVDAKYQSVINQYFADVAHDSGGPANVYSVDTQYSDGSGSIQ